MCIHDSPCYNNEESPNKKPRVGNANVEGDSSSKMGSTDSTEKAPSPVVPLVLDGGVGHMLRRLGIKIEGKVGSQERFLGVAMANLQQPELVKKTHSAYIQAGARVLTTNNYSCVPRCLKESGSMGREQIQACIHAAGDCAKAAKEESGLQGVQIAGVLPPLGPSYRPDLVPEKEELEQDYAFIAEAIEPYADVLLCETMSLVREGRAAALAASKTGKPVWVAWTLSDEADGTLRSGETIEEAVRSCADIPNIEAMLLNCCSPQSVTVAMPRLRAALPDSVQIGGYANGFVIENAKMVDAYQKDLTPAAYRKIAEGWADSGATMIGGCCGVFPEHIAELASPKCE